MYILLLLALALINHRSELIGEQNKVPKSKSEDKLVSIKSRPDLGIEWDQVAKLKIVTRKDSYRIGEMINIDIAMINTSDHEVFFGPLSRPMFSITDENGKAIAAVPYVVTESTWTPDRYQPVSSGEFMSESFAFLAGCDKRAFAQVGSTAASTELFDKGLFLNWGDSCLQIATPGSFFITAELKNPMVRTSSNPRTKTAVGSIKSTALRITILK